MAKFGGTSKSDDTVASPVASTVIIEETVSIAAISRQDAIQESTPSPVMMSAESPVYAQMPAPVEKVHTHSYTPMAKTAPVRFVESTPMPQFGTAPTNRPKIEIIGEACESCSA